MTKIQKHGYLKDRGKMRNIGNVENAEYACRILHFLLVTCNPHSTIYTDLLMPV